MKTLRSMSGKSKDSEVPEMVSLQSLVSEIEDKCERNKISQVQNETRKIPEAVQDQRKVNDNQTEPSEKERKEEGTESIC